MSLFLEKLAKSFPLSLVLVAGVLQLFVAAVPVLFRFTVNIEYVSVMTMLGCIVGFALGGSLAFFAKDKPSESIVASGAHRINTNRTAAVAEDYYWSPMSACPRGVKVQLLGQGGVATYGLYDGKSTFWQGWAPLPQRRPV